MSDRKNIYTCQSCKRQIVTVDIDEGVTPFMIECEKCNGDMYSSFYSVDQSLKAEFEWYRPESVDHYSECMKQHIADGGLDIRQINQGK